MVSYLGTLTRQLVDCQYHTLVFPCTVSQVDTEDLMALCGEGEPRRPVKFVVARLSFAVVCLQTTTKGSFAGALLAAADAHDVGKTEGLASPRGGWRRHLCGDAGGGSYVKSL
jgi:hypothetical protein